MQKRKRYSKERQLLKKGEYVRGDSYEYKWTDSCGKRHSVYAKTLDELRSKEETVNRDLFDGIRSSNRNLTINDYYSIWLEVKSGIRDSTRLSYIRPYTRYVQPVFGNTRLKDLTYSKLIRFYKNLADEKNLSFSSIRTINCVIGMILDVAVKDNVLRGNVCKGALSELQRELPPPKKVNALTVEEERVLLEFLRKSEIYFKFYPVIVTQLFTGGRVGEILALRPEDCDFENNEIHFTKSLMCYDREKGKGSVWHVGPPKTSSSYRVVPMLPIVKEALMMELEMQRTRNIKCVDEIDGFTNFIFVNAQGHVYNHKRLNTQLYKISAAINRAIKNGTIQTELTEFPKRLHSHMCRHSFVTRLREGSCDVKVASARCGHKKCDVTLEVYTDTSMDFIKREIAVLDQFEF